MTPQDVLQHYDAGTLWPAARTAHGPYPLEQAYQDALALRRLRLARGEQARGFKLGFTNRSIWDRYDVHSPIWGTVYDSTLTLCTGEGHLSLQSTCQPRIEPELVFGMRASPPPHASLEALFDAIDWVAPGFEVVQSHLPDWKFQAADTVADGGLHARLLVGHAVPVRSLAASADALERLLAQARLRLHCGTRFVEEGRGALVLDNPLRALHHFLVTLRSTPGAPDLLPGDVVTTGTWTDAWPIQPGEVWQAEFTAPLPSLKVTLT